MIKFYKSSEARSSCVGLRSFHAVSYVLPAGYILVRSSDLLFITLLSIPKHRQYRELDEQTLSTTLRLPVFMILRIIPPARLATATDEDTRRIKNNWLPAAMIAGIEWSHVRSRHDKRCVTNCTRSAAREVGGGERKQYSTRIQKAVNSLKVTLKILCVANLAEIIWHRIPIWYNCEFTEIECHVCTHTVAWFCSRKVLTNNRYARRVAR